MIHGVWVGRPRRDHFKTYLYWKNIKEFLPKNHNARKIQLPYKVQNQVLKNHCARKV